MVYLVLISHSEKIALGLKDLVSQMSGDVKIATAGGIYEGRIGTDEMKILSSIESALMNAEFALDMIDEEKKKDS